MSHFLKTCEMHANGASAYHRSTHSNAFNQNDIVTRFSLLHFLWQIAFVLCLCPTAESNRMREKKNRRLSRQIRDRREKLNWRFISVDYRCIFSLLLPRQFRLYKSVHIWMKPERLVLKNRLQIDNHLLIERNERKEKRKEIDRHQNICTHAIQMP